MTTLSWHTVRSNGRKKLEGGPKFCFKDFPDIQAGVALGALWRTSEAPSERSIQNSASLCDEDVVGGGKEQKILVLLHMFLWG